ncbi:hypothetical protein Btru_057937 [Bulinus truncatus]|nr:hypothetical protein Btru_057937 [Bulinus truncatus]
MATVTFRCRHPYAVTLWMRLNQLIGTRRKICTLLLILCACALILTIRLTSIRRQADSVLYLSVVLIEDWFPSQYKDI